MPKIDVSEWKDFRVGELFPNFVKPAVLHTRQVVESDEGTPYVVRTKFNNGIKCRVLPVEGVEPSPAGVITWGAENATFFYQTEPFLSGRDIYYIDTRKYSPLTCIFLVSCLQTLTHKYPYNYGLFPDLLKEERIKLPAVGGKPNWSYMDEYMSETMQTCKSNLKNLKLTDGDKHQVNVSKWKDFSIGSIFNVVKGTRLTKARMKPGNTRFIGSSAMNNGCTAQVGNTENVHPKNTLTVCYNGSVGETFYQDEPFLASDDVNVLYPKFQMTREIALFIAPLIKAVSAKYNYVDKWKQEAMIKDTIKLPVTTDGKPDWVYMDGYMRSVIMSAEADLIALKLTV
ncbi:hypothetical protein IGW_05066 [Bacillus cereus ISP3191]|uniref:restriction endonuclease subunit S n=1 Tax=Bacillus cereus group TaxID=86661 RepID=UPI000279690E|nr:restriction endonuclease subunit S [Bacillus cereus]EJQ88387.1 hypothetical protein IGW_05066 [Bacillus cereus ISP3191]MDR4323109.1 restriction endonuclease [Bacillus paranthracis]QUW31419.1 restriction endonuclease subunit S [Bacillus cereus]